MSRTRTRRLAKLLLVAAFLLALGMILSIRFAFGTLITSRGVMFIGSGQIIFVASAEDVTPSITRSTGSSGPFFLAGAFDNFRWWFDCERESGTTVFAIPLWLPTLLLAIPGAILYRRTRPSLAGLCPKCHYDLAGLPHNSPCPECGRRG